MARILIDGKEYEVRDGDNLLAAALGHGLDVPYFCWHPALGSVGACRQCAVTQYKDSQDTRGRLVMACMTPVSEGARFSLQDKASCEFRAGVIEWLMLNHPHDCPVCDEGGECHLQDMTVMTGHIHRRARFAKRTYVSQDLGPFLNHEMNRCITCYRCVRFYRDYAGGTDLHAFASKDHVYFGRHEDGPLESPFSGNLAEVCPTGVFTDRTLAGHYTRKWDLQSAPSLCMHCGLGCNTFAAERYGTLRRIANRYHREINGYFLCDRGRFGYEFANGPERLRQPWIRSKRGEVETGEAEALVQHLVARLDGLRLVGVGSPRASLEDNYALRRLVGRENFYSGLGEREHTLAKRALQLLRETCTFSLHHVEECDAVLVLGEDVEATNPRLALALRQSARNRALAQAQELGIPAWQDASIRDATAAVTTPIHIVSPLPTGLDAIARHALRWPPEEIALLAEEIAALLRGESPEDAHPSVHRVVADEMADTLRASRRPLVVAGAVEGTEAILVAAQGIVDALTRLGREAGLVTTAAEANTTGVALLQGAPIEEAPTGPEVAYIVLENDLFRRLPAHDIDQKLHGAGMRVVLDALPTATTAEADVVLPTTTFAEAGGVYVNNEGRAQRAFQVHVPALPVRAAWRWLGAIGAALGRTPEWASESEVIAAAAEAIPELRPALASLTAPVPPAWRIARQSHRYSGRTAMNAHETVHEPPPPVDTDSPFSFSMEGFGAPVPAGLLPRYWVPRWNSGQALNFHQREIAGALPGGESGVRLFPTPTGSTGGLAAGPSAPCKARWRVVPLYQLFGSEELSARAPAIAARATEPHAALHPDDAQALGLEEGDTVQLVQGDMRWLMRVRLQTMARGVVAVTAGRVPYVRFHQPVEIISAAATGM